MNDDILKDILFEVHRIECGIIDDLPDYKPSLRHRLAMKRIFARFDRNTRKLREAETPTAERRTRKLGVRQRVLIVMLIVILMALFAGCASTIFKFISEHFQGTVYEDNTQLFAVNLENCPQTIEYQYVLTNVPEGFELIETIPSSTYIYTCYLNDSTGQIITLNQWVKSHFSTHYNTEKGTFEEIEINGTAGLLIEFSNNGQINSTIIWDNGDYIIEISADLDKKSTLDLSNITKL